MRCSKGCGEATGGLGLTRYCPACAPPGVRLYPIAAPQDPQPKAPSAPEPDPANPWPAPGTPVLYTLGHGPSAGQQRPAIVIRHLDELRAPSTIGAFIARLGIGHVPEALRASFLALTRADPDARLARPLALVVLTDPGKDGLERHVAHAAYSAQPLAWHWMPRPDDPPRDL